MTYIRKLWNLLLYAGAEKEEYRQMLPEIWKKNRELLKAFSLFGTVMFFLLFIVSRLTGGFPAMNSRTYLLCGTGMLLILLGSRYAVPAHPALVMPLVYGFEILLYVFGIRISLLHADKSAVSAVAILLVCPLLFYDRPIRLSCLTAAVVAVFSAIVIRMKEPEMADGDVWNMITFGALAMAATVYMMRIKIQTLMQSGQIERMSQTDLLTGVKNRNYYENRLDAYGETCLANLCCVYADVNGLHEMNNREGHAAGDRMLCEVAAVLQAHFDPEHTYRLGGDEFIAFRMDGHPETLQDEIAEIRRELARKGYHVSFGTAAREKARGRIDMREMVNEAESNMFADKREFYRRAENDRRSR